MTRGAPDGTVTFANVGYIGQGVTAYSIQGSVTAESSGYADLTVPDTGTENMVVHVIISVNDDEAIHAVKLTRVSDGWIWFYTNFILNYTSSLPTVSVGAGATARMTFYNNHTSDKTFTAIVYWVTRQV